LSQPSVPPAGVAVPEPPRPPARGEPWLVRRDLVVAAGVVGVLVGVGALVGLLWAAVSPRTVGLVLRSGAVIPDETEGFVGTDGWFALLTMGVGLLAAIALWTRRSWRGPAVVAALAVGGVGGSLSAALVGRLSGGGQSTGKPGTVITLPVSVHAVGLLFAQGALAVLVYGLLVAFAKHDDLGRTDGAGAPTEPRDEDLAGPARPVSWPPE
jgi:hypothetical protein